MYWKKDIQYIFVLIINAIEYKKNISNGYKYHYPNILKLFA